VIYFLHARRHAELGVSDWGRGSAVDRERWIAALAAHPELIQRPIITTDDGYAVVGRSTEALREVIEHQPGEHVVGRTTRARPSRRWISAIFRRRPRQTLIVTRMAHGVTCASARASPRTSRDRTDEAIPSRRRRRLPARHYLGKTGLVGDGNGRRRQP
jgi:ArsC family